MTDNDPDRTLRVLAGVDASREAERRDYRRFYELLGYIKQQEEEMGQFSNGSEWCSYEETHCVKCLHYGDGDCALAAAHMMWQDSQNQELLDYLIPPTEDGLGNKRCEMFIQDPNYGQLDIFEPIKDQP